LCVFEAIRRKGIPTDHSDARARYAVLKERAETRAVSRLHGHVAPEPSSTEGRARAAQGVVAKRGQLLQNRAVKPDVTGSGGARAGPAVQARLAGTSRVGRVRDAE